MWVVFTHSGREYELKKCSKASNEIEAYTSDHPDCFVRKILTNLHDTLKKFTIATDPIQSLLKVREFTFIIIFRNQY